MKVLQIDFRQNFCYHFDSDFFFHFHFVQYVLRNHFSHYDRKVPELLLRRDTNKFLPYISANFSIFVSVIFSTVDLIENISFNLSLTILLLFYSKIRKQVNFTGYLYLDEVK